MGRGFSIFNTLGRRVEEVLPLEENSNLIRIYTCGPTVYSYPHIGNMRTYVFSDTLRRALEFVGYEVLHVMNITDVGHMTSDEDEGEDKIEAAARREKKDPWEIAEYYTKVFFEDVKRLNILMPHHVPRATQHIDEMIKLIERILANGYAYVRKSGVYFDTSKFKEYGKLSGIKLDGQHPGARVEVNPDKKSPFDFVLWVLNRPNHIMQWDSPWGRGFPGWHIECTAMGMKYLGEQFEIHTGGIDHIPVHHENEIAQAEAATGKSPYVRYWVHGNFLKLKEEKMSKSAGGIYRLVDLEKRGYHPLAFRLLCFTVKYRQELNFSWESLKSAAKNLRYIYNFVRLVPPDKENERGKMGREYLERFTEAIKSDLNMPAAVAALLEMINESYKRNDFEVFPYLLEMDKVLGLNLWKVREEFKAEVPEEVLKLVQEREKARAEKDYNKADELREKIKAMGYYVEDTPNGPVIRKERII